MDNKNLNFIRDIIHPIDHSTHIHPGAVYYETHRSMRKSENWKQRVSQFFGFGPYQGYCIHASALEAHDAKIKELVKEICYGFASTTRMHYNWENAGYDESLFILFLVLITYREDITWSPSRMGEYARHYL